MPNSLLLRASQSDRARRVVSGVPVTRRIVERFVAGETIQDAVLAVERLRRAGFLATVDVLGEHTESVQDAEANRNTYVCLLYELSEVGVSVGAEVSIKLSALGQSMAGGGELAFRHAQQICAAAEAVGARVSLDMENYATVDSTLGIGTELRRTFPSVGSVLQANLRRTESDASELADAGARVRLVKGAYKEPASVAFERKSEVDAAYKRTIDLLMTSRAYPMVATHDPAVLHHARAAAAEAKRGPSEYEFQMLYGIRSDLQHGLIASGERVRVYVPFGADWYAYFMRRLAERPANVAFLLRSLTHR